MATSPSVKMETDAPSYIKPDPDTAMQSQPMDEDDDFEDTGELEMPPQPQNVWLLRLPRALHESWNKIDQDQEFRVGVIRRGKKSGNLTMELDLLPIYDKVERDYSIRPLNEKTKNTYIFSEKDLPGFKKSSKNGRNGTENNPVFDKGGVDKNRRFQRNKAIPKQTRLAHVITHESMCQAIENDFTRNVRRLRAQDEENNRPEVKLDMEDGFAPEIQSFMNLSKNRREMGGPHRGKAAKSKPQENKNARMERGQLLDRLFRCFKQYQYWSMKALRDELKQPEAYLKENLENIADLVRSGRFNGLYTLKPEHRPENFNLDEVKPEVAPEESDLEALSGGDDDDMEDASDTKDEPT